MAPETLSLMLALRRGVVVAVPGVRRVPAARRLRAGVAVVVLGVLVFGPKRRCLRVGFAPTARDLVVGPGCSTVVTVVVTVAPPAW
jgi:hypothetical protein